MTTLQQQQLPITSPPSHHQQMQTVKQETITIKEPPTKPQSVTNNNTPLTKLQPTMTKDSQSNKPRPFLIGFAARRAYQRSKSPPPKGAPFLKTSQTSTPAYAPLFGMTKLSIRPPKPTPPTLPSQQTKPIPPMLPIYQPKSSPPQPSFLQSQPPPPKAQPNSKASTTSTASISNSTRSPITHTITRPYIAPWFVWQWPWLLR